VESHQANGFDSSIVNFLLNSIDEARRALHGQGQLSDTTYEREKVEKKVEEKKKEESKNNNFTYELPELEKKIQLPTDNGLLYIVDDQSGILEFLITTFEDLNYRVKGFTSPVQALEALKVELPDIVLVDFKMPEMDGGTLIKKMRSHAPTLPYLMMSGHVDKKLLTDCLSQGLAGCLEKPFHLPDLIDLVEVNVFRFQSRKLLERSLKFIMSIYAEVDKIIASLPPSEFKEYLKKEPQLLLKEKARFDNKLRQRL
jgi:CheY-like chemotaxis protein